MGFHDLFMYMVRHIYKWVLYRSVKLYGKLLSAHFHIAKEHFNLKHLREHYRRRCSPRTLFFRRFQPFSDNLGYLAEWLRLACRAPRDAAPRELAQLDRSTWFLASHQTASSVRCGICEGQKKWIRLKTCNIQN